METLRYDNRHYEDVAEIIRGLQDGRVLTPNGMTATELLLRFAILFERDDPHFDRPRFLAACRVRDDGTPEHLSTPNGCLEGCLACEPEDN